MWAARVMVNYASHMRIIFCAPCGWVNDDGSGDAAFFIGDEDFTVSVWI